jgi:hypothetical protein
MARKCPTIHEWKIRGGSHSSAGKRLMANRIKQGKCGSGLSISKDGVEFTEPQPWCRYSAEHAVSQKQNRDSHSNEEKA